MSPYQQSWLKEHPVTQVGVYANNRPPFEVVGGGKRKGMTFAYLDAVAKQLGVSYGVTEYSSHEALISAACRGEVDVVLGISFTSDNSRCLIFTEPYFRSPSFVIGRQGESRAGPGGSLSGLRIVTGREFSEQTAVKTRYPNAVHLTAVDDVSALEMVRDGKADLYLGDPYVFIALSETHDIRGLALLRHLDVDAGAMHFAIPDSRKTLAEAINAALLRMTPAARQAIQDKWLPALEWVDKDVVTVSPEERKILQKPLRLLVLGEMGPISIVDDDGVPEGLAAEYLRRFQVLGAHFTIITTGSWKDARERMGSGEVDAVLSIPMPSEKDPGWVYSLPYLTVSNVIVSASNSARILDASDLNHKRVAVSDPVRLTGQLLAQAPQARVVAVGNDEDGLEAVHRGSVDAYVGNLVLVDKLIRHKYAGRLQVAAPAGVEDRIAFAFSQENSTAASAFNRMLGGIPLRERQAIRDDWLSEDYKQPHFAWQSILKWAIPLLLCLIATGIAQNVSNLRLRREVAQRREVESRLDRITSNLPAVVYRLERTAKGTLSLPYIAGDMQALFGLSAESAMSDFEKIISRVHPDDVDLVMRDVEASARDLSFLDIQFRSHPDLGLHWIQAKGRPWAEEEGRVSWSGYWIDVTQAFLQSEDLKAAKVAAEAAVSAKAEFLATMSHEIRTPMSGIRGFLEMLEQTDPDEEQRRILQVIGESARVLSQILDDILDYSKIEAGAMELDPMPEDLRQAMDHVQRMLAAQAAEKGLRISVYVDPSLSDLHYVDGIRLKQILFNLLSNAIKFTHRGEVILSLQLLHQADGLQTISLSVGDTGIGISEDQKGRLFQPFSQAERSIARRFGGTGLGLSICRRLVELMHGTLSLQSELGVGTTATVELTLPIASAECGDMAGGLEGESQPALQPQATWTDRRVLVAEDHPTNQMLMRWRLGQLGLFCEIAADGAMALDALASGSYDLLITDCQMPVLDGYELAREIRRREAEHKLPRLPIIAMTASVLDEDVAACMRAGMDDFLAKPVPLNELRNTVERWLSVSQNSREFSLSPDQTIWTETNAWAPNLVAMSHVYGSMGAVVDILVSLSVATHQDVARAVQAHAVEDQQSLLKVLHRMVGSLGALVDSSAALSVRDLIKQIESDGLAASASRIGDELDQIRSLVMTLEAMLDSMRSMSVEG